MKNEISFVKVNILEHWRWWNNYCSSHTAQEVKEEVMAQANAMLAMDLISNERAKKLLEEAISFSQKKRMAGAIGGQKRAMNAGQNVKTLPQRPTTKTAYPTKDELYDFAQENNIADGIARQFYEINESRGWRHSNGQPISNWKGALINFCKRINSSQVE